MVNPGNISRVVIGFLALVLFVQPAQAHPGWERGRHQLYYVNDHYPVRGQVVFHLPNTLISVGIGGHRYYYCDGIFYRRHPRYYVVVPPPPEVIIDAVQNQPEEDTGDAGETFTVNIPNSKGGYTPVTLKRSGKGFIGPQGEFYPEFPKVEQLKVMYVKGK